MTPQVKTAIGIGGFVAAYWFYTQTKQPTPPGASAAGAPDVINDAGQVPVGTALQFGASTTSVAGSPYAVPVDQQGSIIYGGVGPTPTDVINAANTSTVPNVPLGAFHVAVPFSATRLATLASNEAKFAYQASAVAIASPGSQQVTNALMAQYSSFNNYASFRQALQAYSGSGWSYQVSTDTFTATASGPNGVGRFGYTGLTGMEPLDKNGAPIGVAPTSSW
jgi:hypothetical protein